MLTPRTQATILLTVPFPGDKRSPSPLAPTEWGRFAEWLRARSLMPEDLLSDRLQNILSELQDKTVTRERVESLLERGTALGILMEKWSRAGLWVMTRADSDYPPRLKRHLGAVSPAVLFGCGNRDLLSKGGVAVVGSRNTGAEELAYSRQLGALAAANGHSIVSGGARGVDEAAMLGAMENEGTAVGVLANGLLQAATSPKYRDHLTRRNLALISSSNPEAGFDVGLAMQRNKYIYCLAEIAVVVHSGKKGGTWTGALENLKKKWVPMWIKETADPEAGNQTLLEYPDALRMPDDIDKYPFDKLFSRQSDSPDSTDITLTQPAFNSEQEMDPPALAPKEGAMAVVEPETTFYELFLNKLHNMCQTTPCRIDELQETLDLNRSQLKVWLNKAVEEGRVTKLARPERYQYVRQGVFLPE